LGLSFRADGGTKEFRRLVVRYEFHAENFLGMVRLGCVKIVLRYL